MPSKKELKDSCDLRYPARQVLGMRAGFLFFTFLLIVMALYNLKPASRSLFIEYLGADQLPYVWIGTALTMAVFIGIYHRVIERFSRVKVVLATCLSISLLLVVFRFFLSAPGPVVATAFYIFVDILGVLMVEQFWSLTNSIYSTSEGKSWYGFIGTGGLTGGVIGSGAAALILKLTPLQTADLLLVAAGIILLLFVLTWLMGRLGLYCEVELHGQELHYKGGWKVLKRSRFLILIAAILLLAQLASPLIEFQFLKTVAVRYPLIDSRTAFLSLFFSLMGGVSIAVNLLLTPLIHRYFGVISGLLVQPVMIALCTLGFMFQPGLLLVSAAKISDRGLSYSINRASKELLYVPIDSLLIYQAKAWIDMFGYRLFKIFGSILILFFTRWISTPLSLPQLSWLVLGICLIWLLVLQMLRAEYRDIDQEP
ncbi:MAG: Npt1/Npt2 family nucleotide transporter [Desulfuromusa sp.]|nr:Npt1/Npt2 family nucleotide transporter [Desulfuromusa sp.]